MNRHRNYRYRATNPAGTIIGTIVLVIAVILGIGYTISNSVKVGNVEGHAYSVKLTNGTFIGAGNWIYYTPTGEERPLKCTRFLNIECKSEDGVVKFSTQIDKNDNLTFPRIEVNGKAQDIICAKRFIGSECLTTMKN